MRIAVLWFALLIPVYAQTYVRVDSPADRRTYSIDVDSTAVQRALRPVSDGALAAKLPKWLYPGANFKPVDLSWDPVSGVISGVFQLGGTVQEVSALYDQVLRSHGLRVSSVPDRGSVGLQMTGSGSAETVMVRIEPQSGSIRAKTTYAPRNPRRPHYDVVWYDDRTGILRVRDRATGDEYQLEKRSIVANNLNRTGAVASEDVGMPSWLPVYPGATRSPKGRIVWLFRPTAEFVTGDPIRNVYDFYLAQVRAVGATVKSSGMDRSGTPLRDFSAYVIAVQGDGQVEIRIAEVDRVGYPSSTPGRRTGIGIRYTVPKR